MLVAYYPSASLYRLTRYVGLFYLYIVTSYIYGGVIKIVIKIVIEYKFDNYKIIGEKFKILVECRA